MEALELTTTTEAEARFDAAGGRYRTPVGIATGVKGGAMPAAAVPSAGGLGSAAGIYAAADVPPGTAGRAAALGV
ncbi:MAG: hypothetical protein ACYC33_04500 [Thermoleophilia bacterium]